ncbi:uncharacterized protein LOC116342813 [Contarinia nasturtii]|uniref:uncharacterized protein LOC116342813 n=1 Tax=Contarinia nasturtii TaxID=265458 RepID=UPI0012D4A6E9|nr:uncharacterized protein LOC116342813 [Contarinia nasturtii]
MNSNSQKWAWSKVKISNISKEIDQMTPKGKAMLVVKACRLMCDSIGVRFLSDSRVFWLSYAAGTMVLIYLILAVYTVIYNTYNNNFSHGIKATCVVGIAVPSVLLYFETINSNRFMYRRILLFATDFIYPDTKEDTKLNNLCDFYGKKSIRMTILFMNFILLSTAQAMIGPMLEFMKTGHLITFLAIKLPFLDEDVVWAFHLNLMLQTTITTFGTIGGLAIETTSCIINNTIMLCSEIILMDCSELGNQLETGTTPPHQIYVKL